MWIVNVPERDEGRQGGRAGRQDAIKWSIGNGNNWYKNRKNEAFE